MASEEESWSMQLVSSDHLTSYSLEAAASFN
jgi:hypothetical protein